MADDLLSVFTGELEELFRPITDVVDNPLLLPRLLSEIGVESDAVGGDTLVTALSAIANLVEDARQLAAAPSPSFADIASVLQAVGTVFQSLRALSVAGSPAQQIETFGIDLVDLLVASYLRRAHPVARQVVALLTLLEPAETQPLQPPLVVNGVVVQSNFHIDRFHLDRISALLHDPVGTLRAAYVTPLVTVDDANAMADKLFPRIHDFLRTLGVACRYGFRPGDEPLLGDAAPIVDHALIVWVADQLMGATAEAGIVFTLSPAERGDLGLLASPFGTLQVKTQAGAWAIELDITAQVEGVAYGRHGVTLVASVGTAEVDAKFTATLAAPDKGPAFILGSPNGSRLEVGGSVLSAQTSLSEAQQSLALSAAVSKASLCIMPGDGDGFLQGVLPAGGLQADFDLGIAWSNEAGLSFHGAAGLEAALPIGVSIGGVVQVPVLYLGLRASDTGMQVEFSTAVALSIGPVQAVLDRLGLLIDAAFPQGGGNLGPVDVSVAFKPPSGIGLSVEATAVSGGGFLSHAGDQYSGALELSICGVAVKAFGLIQTQLPDGAKGYSALVILTAEFSPGLQIGYDFTLDGVGGLLGINRTVSTANVETAIWAHHFDGLLFPNNPVTAAPALMTAIDSYFPAAEGRYLFGPLAKIGWGDGMVEVLLGLVIELPEPIKLLLLGEVDVQVPVKLPQLNLHIDFAGGIDFGQKLAFFDASLHDSKIERYPLGGDLAFRYDWGDAPVFALAVGGFNPSYQAPANFPTLKRLSLAIGAPDVQMTAQAYVAMTSNTLQFGARIELTAGTSSLNVHGFLGFDALVEWDPFAFSFALSAGVDLRAGGSTLASVHLDGTVAGTSPWHVSGDASVSFLFFDVSVHVDKQWGDTDTALPAPDPTPLVIAALQDPSAWIPLASAFVNTVITAVSAPTDAAGALLLDPSGGLRITQNVAPLGQAITRFAGTPLAAPVTLDIDSANVSGATTTANATAEFALAQFVDMTDDQKLSLPSFQPLDAGIDIGGDGIDLGQSSRSRSVATSLAYETTIIDSEAEQRPGASYVLSWESQLAMHARLVDFAMPPPLVTLAAEQYIIAGSADLKARPDVATDGTKLGALTALNAYVSANPAARGQLQIVLASEAA
jgi:hypothetical protein